MNLHFFIDAPFYLSILRPMTLVRYSQYQDLSRAKARGGGERVPVMRDRKILPEMRMRNTPTGYS